MFAFSTLRVAVATVAVVLAGCAAKPVPPPPPPAPAPYTGPVLQIEQIDRGVQIVLPSVVLFDVNKSTFDAAQAGPFLERLAGLLTRKTDKRVSVEGHTDSDGSAALNDTLSKARAAAVAEAMAARGVQASRMVTAGYSFNRPVASNSTEDGKRLNRRVELIVLDEKVENLTAGEPAGSFESAFAKLKSLVDRGLVKPVEQGKP
ncbi:OmpA family protein [Ideonella sp. A 288]|uniref:OmpA family protein n=1 Tax=Ideonella sp. A 288 TaxID=1962181 RepID=UPI00130390D1|nr:OmpA family protein [Ideonella sp. A 288]